MKIGDYVRTINGIIAKIESKRDYTTGDYIGGENDFFLNVNHSYQDYDKIVKSSPNIIDLIEVGDYVDKLRVVDKEENYIVVETFDERIFIQNEDTINSILTKEQFESMEYKVKE